MNYPQTSVKSLYFDLLAFPTQSTSAEQRWLLLKNKNAPAPAAAEPPAKKRKKSEKRVEKKKKKQRSRVWDLDKKKYVTS